MNSLIDPNQLLEWCMIKSEDLITHPSNKVKLRILSSPTELYRDFASEVVKEIEQHNQAHELTRLIFPCGPRGPISYLTNLVNKRRISLKNVHIFHMDDHLDWQGRPISEDHPFSYRGWMSRNFYENIDAVLNVPYDQRHWPSPYDIDGISREIEIVGGIDTVYGGVGYRGHIAYNEPPRSPWYSVSIDEYRNSKTRVLPLNDDTLVAISQRATGGNTQVIPPFAITIGMKDILNAHRIRLYSETGAWKQMVLRVLLFGPVTVEYPVTFCQEHPDFVMTVDKNTAEPPILENNDQMRRLIKV
jgi:glucosamine-6-phosphate deaminase